MFDLRDYGLFVSYSIPSSLIVSLIFLSLDNDDLLEGRVVLRKNDCGAIGTNIPILNLGYENISKPSVANFL